MRTLFSHSLIALIAVAGLLLGHNTPAQAQVGPWIAGYLPTYRQTASGAITFMTAEDYDKLTLINHVGLGINADGSFEWSNNSVTTTKMAAAVAAAHANQVPINLTLAGWYDSYYPAISTATQRTAIINNLLALFDTYGYDGIDMDFEPVMSPWISAIQSQNPNYVAFIEELHSALQSRTSPLLGGPPLLTVAATGYAGPVFNQLEDKFDQINLMTYDLSGPYPGWVVWHDSAVYDGGATFPSGGLLPSVHGEVTAMLNAGVAPGKIGVGVIFDAYRWMGGSGVPVTGGVTKPLDRYTSDPSWTRFSYSYMMQNIYQTANYHWDSVTQMSYLSFDNAGSANDQFWSFNDEASCAAKATYTLENNLGGVMIWELHEGYIPTYPAGERMPQLDTLYATLYGAQATVDYGDAPDIAPGTTSGDYQTSESDDGPRHAAVSALWLGVNAPDGDNGTLQNSAATADDLSKALNDEDGISSLPLITPFSSEVPLSVAVHNNTGSPATAACWIDFNRDGHFAATERADALVASASGTQSINLVFSGFDVPVPGYTYLRCRVASAAAEVATASGAANSGEVEDYRLSISSGSAIGNRIWLDENANGRQDAAEPGLANVRVQLKNSSNQVIAVTVTDAAGGYLFNAVIAGSYYVQVDNASLPAGMIQTALSNPGGDLGNQSDAGWGYAVTIPAGAAVRNLTADFGYNTQPESDITGNTGLTAVGDRVWIDSNGNGSQDKDEVGASGVTVALYGDADGNAVYDTLLATAVTDRAGYYRFSGLPPAAYVLRVTNSASASHDVLNSAAFTASGDPDHFAASGSHNDSATTKAVLLSPGDLFSQVDFGYQPLPGAVGSIGGSLWFDANASATLAANNGEYNLSGITVTLLRDTNGDGSSDFNGADDVWGTADDEPVLATTTSDTNGAYHFSGLALNAAYIVWVNDSAAATLHWKPTYDPDGATPRQSAVLLSTAAPNAAAESFSFTPLAQTNATGLIGGVIWLDANNNSQQDTGELPLRNAAVSLLDSNSSLIDSITSDTQGRYNFGGLAAGTYTVLTTPPAGLSSSTDSRAPQQTLVVTIGNGEIALQAHVGLVGGGAIGNLIWQDWNGDGVAQAGEPGLAGLHVELYPDLDANGQLSLSELPIAGAVSAANGSYLLPGLALNQGSGYAAYMLVISDPEGVLNGMTHTVGVQGSNNTSQEMPYQVFLAPEAPSYLAADFGYGLKYASLGNFVWRDQNDNALQDANEPGLNGVLVTLQVAYPDGTVISARTLSGDDPATPAVEKGWYSFGNLLLDENILAAGTQDPMATDLPLHTLAAAAPLNYMPVTAGGADGDESTEPLTDSNLQSGTIALPLIGQNSLTQQNASAEAPVASYDFGFKADPLAVTLADFAATSAADQIVITWETVSELDNAGFNLYRSITPAGPQGLLAALPSQAAGGSQGAHYRFADRTITAGQSYWYWLEDVALDGTTTLHGPVSAVAQAPSAVTLRGLAAGSPMPVTAWPWVVASAATALAAAARRSSAAKR